MPKLVDYSARHDLTCEAVVRLAALHGAGGVTMPAVAAELKASTATLRRFLDSPTRLPELGVGRVDEQRNYRRFRRQVPLRIERGSVEHVRWVLQVELPKDDEELEHARAWAALTSNADPDGMVARLRNANDVWLDRLCRASADYLVPAEEERELAAIMLRALLDGLIHAACRATVTTDQMLACLDQHLGGFSSDATGAPR